MTMTRGSMSNLIAPGFRKIILESYKQHPMISDKWVNKETSKRMYEETYPIAGFDGLSEVAEGGTVTYQDPIQGSTKRFTFSKYGKGFRITEELYDDDLYGITGGRMSKALGRSVKNNQEVVAHSILNNGFNTSFVGFESGKSLFSTTHATLRGGTIANRPATDADFGLLTYQAALEHFDTLTDESGLLAMFSASQIIHTPTDQWIVGQILKSQYLPGTNQNDINVAAEFDVTPIKSAYLTDADAWFVLASKDSHRLIYWDRKAPKFTNTDDFDTGDAKFKVTRRNGAGFDDWRGSYGSSGG